MYRRFLNNDDYLSIITQDALSQLVRKNENRYIQAEQAAEASITDYLSENFEIEQGMFYGCPEWLLWILYIEAPDWGIFESRNPNLDNVPDVEGRILEDFLNMIRLAMLYPEERMREEFPVDVENALEAEGNRMVMEKYDIVVNYMKDTYNVDLQAVADILQEQ